MSHTHKALAVEALEAAQGAQARSQERLTALGVAEVHAILYVGDQIKTLIEVLQTPPGVTVGGTVVNTYRESWE